MIMFEAFVLFLLAVCSFRTSALVTPASPIQVKPAFSPNEKADSGVLSFRKRSTQVSDISEISSMLASATVKNYEDGATKNWKVSVDWLRAKATFESQLKDRLQAIGEGRAVTSKLYCTKTEDLSDEDRLRLVWSHDAFRNKLRKAIKQVDEPHVWKDHNFSLTPEGASWLQHKMVTVEAVDSGEIVGFCEVAMLCSPIGSKNGNECSFDCVPSIVNLVTSPRHRRKGIASSLLRTVARYVRQEWGSDEVGLYVDSQNLGAQRLYRVHGFGLRDEHRNDSQLFMTLDLRS